MPFMNRLSMDERQSIIRLLRLRWPERRIARETGFHPQSGKYRWPRLSVMKLSNSWRAFRRIVWKSSTEICCKLHEEAFAKFSGAPHTI